MFSSFTLARWVVTNLLCWTVSQVALHPLALKLMVSGLQDCYVNPQCPASLFIHPDCSVGLCYSPACVCMVCVGVVPILV